MKLVALGLFVAALVLAPLLAFQSIVIPELLSLKQVYGNAEAVAGQAASP